MRLRALVVTVAVAGALTTPVGAPVEAGTPTRCHGFLVTLTGTTGADRLVGTAGRDVISAGPGDDLVDGRGGDDVICGGAGADVLRGGGGSDRLYGDGDQRVRQHGHLVLRGDTLIGGPGNDALDPGADQRPGVRVDRDGVWVGDVLSFSGAPHGIRVDLAAGTARGEGSDRVIVRGPVEVVGTPHDDVLRGGDGPDRLLGQGGHDLLDGRGAPDDLRGGAGDDRLTGGPGDDVLAGDAGNDVLLATDGHDVAEGGGGDDGLHIGSGGVVSFAGSAVPVQVDLGLGTATGDGTDHFTHSDGATGWTLVGSSHADTITGSPYADRIDPGPGADVVDAGDGADTIAEGAGSGDDQLGGGPGDDRIVSRGGDDLVDGGDGTDEVTYPADEDRSAADAVNVEAARLDGLVDGDSISGEVATVVWTTRTTAFATRLDTAAGTLSLGSGEVGRVTGAPLWRLTTLGRVFVDGSEGPDHVALTDIGRGKGVDVDLLGGDDVLEGDFTNGLVSMGSGDDTVSGEIADSTIDGGADQDTVAVTGHLDQCDNFEIGTCDPS